MSLLGLRYVEFGTLDACVYPVPVAKLGVTKLTASSYNQSVMPTVTDAMQESKFASARVLARLPRVSAALSVCPAIASASQPVR
jgi:hypothetical protein